MSQKERNSKFLILSWVNYRYTHHSFTFTSTGPFCLNHTWRIPQKCYFEVRHQGPIIIKTKEKNTAGQAKSVDCLNKKLQVQSSERFWQFYFFTKRSTFCIHFPENKMQNCYLFCLCLSFRLKVKKRYLLWKRSQVFSSFEWMIFWRQYCPLFIHFSLYQTMIYWARKRFPYIFLSLSSDLIKGAKRYLFCSWKWCSQKRQNGTFYAVGNDVVKSAKKVPF